MYTEEEWEKYQDMQGALVDFAAEYVHMTTGLRTTRDMVLYIERVYIEDGRIEIEYDDSCCGCASSDYASAPVHYLWTDNWQEEEIAAQERRKRLEAEKQEAAKRIADRKQEDDDRAMYLRLKEKFEADE